MSDNLDYYRITRNSDGAYELLEYISFWATEQDAADEAQQLIAQTAQRTELVTQARNALAQLDNTREGDSNDAEIKAGHNCAELLSALCNELETASLIYPRGNES